MNPVMATPHFKMNLWNYTPDILLLQPIFLEIESISCDIFYCPLLSQTKGLNLSGLLQPGMEQLIYCPALKSLKFMSMYPSIHPPFQIAVDSLSFRRSFARNPSPVQPTCI
jgi:hypothetical protein